MFTIPNGASAADLQAQPDKVDWDVLAQGYGGDGVGTATDCVVAAQASPNMTVAVTAGSVSIGSSISPVTAGNVTITAADATNPRFDLVVASNLGVLSAVAGTPGAAPVFPAIPSNSLVLAAVYVPATVTSITSARIVDKRVLTTGLPRELLGVVYTSNDSTTDTSADGTAFSPAWGGNFTVASRTTVDIEISIPLAFNSAAQWTGVTFYVDGVTYSTVLNSVLGSMYGKIRVTLTAGVHTLASRKRVGGASTGTYLMSTLSNGLLRVSEV